MSQKFSLGHIVATPGALRALLESDENASVYLSRHVSGDWGELCPEDKASNDQALVDGTRLLSAYTLQSGVRIWIITESDRSATTVLLPEEY